jgi:hypothetical protein
MSIRVCRCADPMVDGSIHADRICGAGVNDSLSSSARMASRRMRQRGERAVSRSVTRTRASRICWRVTRCRCTGGPSQMRSSDRQDGSLMMAHLPRRGK